MPANTAIIPIKAVRLGDQATGDVRGIGELESGDKISPSYLNLTDVSLSGNAAFDTSTLFVDGTNNRVGINSSSPQKNLQINDSTSPTIRFSRDTSYYWEIGHTSSDFQLNSQTGGTIMHLNYDGNVGIGTTSPAEQLEVYGTEASGGVELLLTNYGDGGGTTTPYTAIRSRLNPVRNGGEIRFGRDSTYSSAADADSNIQFYTALDDVNTERMRINSSGNVGIGLTSPSEKLHVNGTIGTEDQFIADSAFVASTPGYSFRGDTDTGIFRATADEIGVSTGGTERMRIDSSGKVGIGVDPSYTLDVDTGGTAVTARFARGGLVASPARTLIRFEDSDTSTLLGYIACTTSTTTYATSSDYRLKENVTGITDGIDRVKQLSPSRFNFTASPDTTVDGFLAHEVSSIVPESVVGEKDAVDDEGNPEYQGIDQSKLVPLLTAALKESIAKIEALETRVATLENN